MTESIQVSYSKIPAAPFANHKTLVYTDSSGDQQFLRGGPTADTSQIPADVQKAEIFHDLTGVPGEGANDPFGKLKASSGPWGPGAADYSDSNVYENIVSGADLSSIWQQLTDRMNFSSNVYDYHPLTQNSNTMVDDALRWLHLPEPQKDGPGPGDHWAPGSNHGLPSPLPYDPGDPFDPRNPNSPFNPDNMRNPNWRPNHDPLRPPLRDPLVIDADGDGRINFISASNSNVYLDLNRNGFAERVSWVGPADGIIVQDLNADGIVQPLTEFFGDASHDGFEQLAQLDANGDGLIDSRDAAFSSLRIWRDLNSDGLSTPDELRTLNAAGIVSLNTSSSRVGIRFEAAEIGREGAATTIGGSSTIIYSAYLSSDRLLSQWQAPAGFSVSDAANALPKLGGFGIVKNLSAAMTLDPQLLTMVTNLVMDEPSLAGSQVKERFEAILLRWTGSEGVGPTTRGDSVDGRHMAVVEALWDGTYEERVGPNSEPLYSPSPFFGSLVEVVYKSFLDSTLANFLTQLPVYRSIATQSPLESSAFWALTYLADAQSQSNLSAYVGEVYRAAVMSFGSGQAAQITAAAKLSVASSGLITNLFRGDHAAFLMAVESGFAGAAAPGLERVLAHLTVGPDLLGSSGGDQVSDGGGWQTVYLGQGNDVLSDGLQNQTFIYLRGDGDDIIDEDSLACSDDDAILFGPGITPSDVSFQRVSPSSNDMIITVAGGGSIRVNGQFFFHYGVGVERIEFSDAGTASLSDFSTSILEGLKTPYNDEIYGFRGDDQIAGGGGDDYLNGQTGDDRYLYELGDGNDQIVEANFNGRADSLRLGGGISATSVAVSRAAPTLDDFKLSFSDGGSVTLVSETGRYEAGVEQILFADGTIWTVEDLRVKVLAAQAAAGGVITGFQFGSDQISGSTSADTLRGLGDDDTYLYNLGGGQDRIEEANFEGVNDTLKLGVGITIANTMVSRVAASSDDFKLTFSDGGSVTLAGETGRYEAGVEQILFADGTIWTVEDLRVKVLAAQAAAGGVITGFQFGSDQISGSTSADTLRGLGDDDTYLYNLGGGQDRIEEANFEGVNDTLKLGVGITIANTIVSRVAANSDDFKLTFSDGGSVTLAGETGRYEAGVERIVFGDGSEWAVADLRSRSLIGTAAAQQLFGSSSDDLIDGKGGDDDLEGGAGSDTYIYNLGDGKDEIIELDANGTDELKLGSGISAASLVISVANGSNDVLITLADGGEIKLIGQAFATRGVEKVTFMDGTEWSRTDLLAHASGPPAPSEVTGTEGSDNLFCSTGNNSLYGLGGDDTYVYNAGDGDDVIYEPQFGGTDTLKFGAGITAQHAVITREGTSDTLKIAFDDRTGSVKIDGAMAGYYAGVETIRFADGTTWNWDDLAAKYLLSQKTAVADIITGFDKHGEEIAGGTGNDLLYGLGGDDTYVYNAGDGDDVIYEPQFGGTDTLKFGAGITAQHAVITREGTSDTLKIAFDDRTGSVKIDGAMAGYYAGVETIRFADGTTWNWDDLAAKYLLSQKTAVADIITGFDKHGEEIAGGTGNDLLYGLGGDDTYVYNAGDGDDVIYEPQFGGTDTLKFGAGITAQHAVITREGTSDTLKIAFDDRTGSVMIDGAMAGYYAGIETIRFNDGVTWTWDDLAARYFSGRKTTGADTIIGFENHNDTIDGGAGDDILTGGSGADTFVFRTGGGNDKITDFNGGADRIDISAFGLTMSQVLAASSETSDGVKIQLATGSSVVLQGIQASALDASWFVLTT